MEIVVQPQQWGLVRAGRSEVTMVMGGQRGLSGLSCSLAGGSRAGLRLAGGMFLISTSRSSGSLHPELRLHLISDSDKNTWPRVSHHCRWDVQPGTRHLWTGERGEPVIPLWHQHHKPQHEGGTACPASACYPPGKQFSAVKCDVINSSAALQG